MTRAAIYLHADEPGPWSSVSGFQSELPATVCPFRDEVTSLTTR